MLRMPYTQAGVPMLPSMNPTRLLVVVMAALSVLASGCGVSDDSGESITVYSGRSPELIQHLLDQLSEATGIEVEARFGDSAELALLISTEGNASPADVFISQSPGALGLLAGEGRLASLDADLISLVNEGFAAADGTWVGLTGRVRVIVYNSDLVDPADLPDSVLDLVDERYAGRVGVAPTNGSFQDFVTAMRNELRDDATLEWLEGMAANDSPNYPKSSPIVEAVGRGEIDMGLVNHYYNLRALEADPSVPSVNHFFPDDDLGSLVIVTGGAVLASADADSARAAHELLTFLLSADAQSTFAAETQEYPLLPGIAAPAGLPTLDGLAAGTIDYDLLGDGLKGTIDLIRESGIER